MANEIKVTAKLSIEKSYLSNSNSVTNLQINQSGDGVESGVQLIGTSAEAISLGDITTAGYAYFGNLESSNTIQIGQDVSAGGFEEPMLLNAGEVALFRIDLATGGVLQAKASGADSKLFKCIYEA